LITVRDGKIRRWHDVTLPSGDTGLPGFLKALGLVSLALKLQRL
jgi:hypothetical protein